MKRSACRYSSVLLGVLAPARGGTVNRLRNSLRMCFVVALACWCAIVFATTTDKETLQQQTLVIFKCVKTKDWKTLFGTMAVTGELKNLTPEQFAKGFASGLEGSSHSNDFETLVAAIQSYSVGAPVIEG